MGGGIHNVGFGFSIFNGIPYMTKSNKKRTASGGDAWSGQPGGLLGSASWVIPEAPLSGLSSGGFAGFARSSVSVVGACGACRWQGLCR